nr:hypothetical protein CFP56_51057 [Quercus suber]
MKNNIKNSISPHIRNIFDQFDTMTFPQHNKYKSYYFQHTISKTVQEASPCYSLEDDTGRRFTEDYA